MSNRYAHWNNVVKAANEDGVAGMIRRGYNVDAFSVRIQTPDGERCIPALFWACRNNDRTGLLNNLVRLGANVNIQDDTGLAATHIAAYHGCTSVLKHLAQLGADFFLVHGRRSVIKNPESAGFLPVHYAVKNNDAEALQWLFLHYPAQIHAKTNNGFSPAMLAVVLGSLDALKVCAKHDDLTRHRDLLEQAALLQHNKIYKFLTHKLKMATCADTLNYAQMGEAVGLSKNGGKTAEQLAKLGFDAAWARLKASDKPAASRTGSSVATKIANSLCGYCGSCKPNKKYYKCSKCLMISYCDTRCQKKAWKGHKKRCKAHARGEPVSWPDQCLAMRLKCGIHHGDIKRVRACIREGYCVEDTFVFVEEKMYDSSCEGLTPLGFAVSLRHNSPSGAQRQRHVVKALLDAGAKINQPSNKVVSASGKIGWIPALFLARQARNVDMMKLLRAQVLPAAFAVLE